MQFNRFQINCIIRVLLLGVSIYLLFALMQYANFYITIFTIGVLPVVQLLELMNYVQRTNRILTRFLRAIQYADFTTMFPQYPQDKTFQDLYQAFNEVVQKFHRFQIEKEEHFLYLQTIVEHIGTGVIVFTEEGRVDLVNRAFKQLFSVEHFRTIHDLKAIDQELYDLLMRIEPHDSALFRLRKNSRETQFAVRTTQFFLHDAAYKLVSFQNIQSVLEQQEMLSWRKLIRVLNHEIMNSLTPITSLASTANAMLATMLEKQTDADQTQELEKLRSAVRVIEKRGQGLLDFVNSYRQLTRVPTPEFGEVIIAQVFERISQLFQHQLTEKEIAFHVSVQPEGLRVYADENLLEQVLLNLIKNAIVAVEQIEEPKVELKASVDARQNVEIEVADNGPGITEQAIERIFIPFFTTKKQGSGIGLSVSREIMRVHGGTICVHSQPHVKTVFSLQLSLTEPGIIEE